MAVTPRELLEAAGALEQRGSEVDLRNAASRAYYAAYHQCRRLAQDLRLRPAPGSGGAHRRVIDALTGSRDMKLRSLGYMLEQCRQLRVAADYGIEAEFPSGDARTALVQCGKILDKAESILRASGGGR